MEAKVAVAYDGVVQTSTEELRAQAEQYRRAGDAAADATRWQEAVAEYERCLSLIGPTPDGAGQDEAELLTALGRCYWNLSQARTAWRTLRRAISLYQERGDGVGKARATVEILRIWGPPERHRTMAEDAMQSLGDAEPYLHARLLLGIGWLDDIPDERYEQAMALGEQHGFDVVIQPSRDVTLTDLSVVTVRSSVVRWLIGHGRVEDAHRCLGQPFSLTSEVVRGEQRGQAIGIPTVSLDLAALDEHMLPADGVYAGQAHWPGADRPHLAAISVGNKPSFGHVQLTIEAHLLDFDADLYGQQVTLEFTHWVRDQIRFPTPDALRQQLARDIEKVRTHQEPSVTCI